MWMRRRSLKRLLVSTHRPSYAGDLKTLVVAFPEYMVETMNKELGILGKLSSVNTVNYSIWFWAAEEDEVLHTGPRN